MLFKKLYLQNKIGDPHKSMAVNPLFCTYCDPMVSLQHCGRRNMRISNYTSAERNSKWRRKLTKNLLQFEMFHKIRSFIHEAVEAVSLWFCYSKDVPCNLNLWIDSSSCIARRRQLLAIFQAWKHPRYSCLF